MRIFSNDGWLRIAAPVLLMSTLNVAHARQMPWEETPPPGLIEDRLRLDVGLWQAGIDTFLRADPTASQPGTTLDGESDIGLSSSRIMPDIELTLLPGKRQMFRLNGFSSHRSGSAVLTRTVVFDDNVYTLGQTVKSTFNLDMVGFGYAYRLIKAPRYEVDIGADVQIASVEANVYVPQTMTREADEGVLPIPMLDAEARWEVFPKWQLMARYRWLGGSGNDREVKGHFIDWRAGVQWQFSQHLGVGLHYRSFGIDVDSASTNHSGALRLNYQGVQLAVRASL